MNRTTTRTPSARNRDKPRISHLRLELAPGLIKNVGLPAWPGYT
jgi:hypothetical protein